MGKATLEGLIEYLFNKINTKQFNVYNFIHTVRMHRWASEDSIKRLMRKLRQHNKISYMVINKKRGIYSI